MDILVFGTGNYYEQYKYLLANDTIIGFIDNDKDKQGVVFENEAIVMPPSSVNNVKYDRIYLASYHMNEMFSQLVDMGVPGSKIFDIRDALNLNNEIERYKNSTQNRVYVFCPFAITGGPEALHQLADSIYRNVTKEVFIVYHGSGNKNTKRLYEKYQNGGIICENDVIDDEMSYVIIPEIELDYINRFKKAKIFYWWLSVDNFFHHRTQHMSDSAYLLNRVSVHMCQSQYARDFLVSCGISKHKILDVSDYTTIEIDNIGTNRERENIVIYNPTKGAFATYDVIKQMDDDNIRFVPIINLTSKQVNELMRKAKVYLDLGRHPGKDRMPREAALNGCCIITGNRGSAYNDYDIMIPLKYKINQEVTDCLEIIALVKDCVYNYESLVEDFQTYRNKIMHEKELFDEQVMMAFG